MTARQPWAACAEEGEIQLPTLQMGKWKLGLVRAWPVKQGKRLTHYRFKGEVAIVRKSSFRVCTWVCVLGGGDEVWWFEKERGAGAF